MRPRIFESCLPILWALGLAGISFMGGCEVDSQDAFKSNLELGKVRFQSYCAACHKLDGTGQENGPPPLAGSNWVAGPETRIIKIVLHGLRGSIEVKGKTYDLEMLSFGPILSDEEIAATLSYVRSHLGNSLPPISPDTVKQVRQATRDHSGYWTVEELLKSP